MKNSFLSVLILILLAMGTDLRAQDVQWRGPNRDGIFPDTELLKEWPVEGPDVLFVIRDLGKGFSSVVATEDMVYTTGLRDTMEYLIAMNLVGEKLWEKPIGRSWNQSFPETRGTPTVEGERLYILTGLDVMACFQRISGELIWRVDLREAYGSRLDMFGVSESVLIVDDKVITTPCGDQTTVIALDKMSGELIWKSGSMNAARGNMSPTLIEHCGFKYVITSTQTHMIGVDPENGEILWDYHYNILSENKENTTIMANTPVYKDSCLWISNGWDVKSVMLEIAPDGRSVSEKFTDQTFDNQNHGMVLVDDYLYGSNFTGRNSGKWVCMNWDTGEIVWIGDFHNKGPLIYADGMLYLIEEKRGHIGLVEATPKEFKLISEFRHSAGAGPYWSRPTIFNKVLYVRHGDALVAYKLSY
jgi:outer membrane protein assembly factor BamB